MLRAFGPSCPIEPIDATKLASLPESAVWIDLFEPTREEERLAERMLGINIPTREEMMEIEPSSRLYQRGNATVITMSVLHGVADGQPGVDPVSFILTDKHLVTVRYVDPRPFILFTEHVNAEPALAQDAAELLVRLFDAIVDRLADELESVSIELDNVSQQIFARETRSSRRHYERRYEVLMFRIGTVQRLLAKIRESSVSTSRALGYLYASDKIEDGSVRARHVRSQMADAKALNDHSDFVVENLNFLLDASLGMISLEQNLVMKIFSIVAVVLMPPTLVAGIYGMNFEHMPELKWLFGYPFGLALIVASAIIPYWWARRKGWL